MSKKTKDLKDLKDLVDTKDEKDDGVKIITTSDAKDEPKGKEEPKGKDEAAGKNEPKDKAPTKEEEPKEDKKPGITPPKDEKPKEKNPNEGIEKPSAGIKPKTKPEPAVGDLDDKARLLKDLFAKFESAAVLSFDSPGAAGSCTAFLAIIKFLSKYPELKLMEMTVDFYRKNKNSFLNPEVALRGLNTDHSADTQHLMATFYTFLSRAGSKEGTTKENFDLSAVDIVVKDNNIKELFGRYIASRS